MFLERSAKHIYG